MKYTGFILSILLSFNIYQTLPVRGQRKALITIEQGGIDNQGRLAGNKNRIRTGIINTKGCVKIKEGFDLMNCMEYDSCGTYLGPVRLKYSNGFYYWDVDGNVRFSFSYTSEDNNSNPFSEYHLGNESEITPYIAPSVGTPNIINLPWCVIIPSSKYPETTLRCPILVVLKDGDRFICCEQHKDGRIIGYISALSKKGRDFQIKKSSIPLRSIIYDQRHDVLYSITESVIYKSYDHGSSWSQEQSISLNIPRGYTSLTTSPTAGIQLKNGVLATTIRAINWGDNGVIENEAVFVLYSKDYGITWNQSIATPRDILCDEAVMAEKPVNSIILNARGGTEYFWHKTMNGRRVFSTVISNKNIRRNWKVKQWVADKSDQQLWDPLCNASLVKYRIWGASYFLYCNPYMPNDYTPRRNLHLQLSKDCSQWISIGIITPYGDILHGYNSIAVSKQKIYIVYESQRGIEMAELTEVVKSAIKKI